ncbi:hypothetical protein ACFLTE_12180, partial [Bacteroidota bacterium]
ISMNMREINLIDIREYTEDDIVTLFGLGLKNFIENLNGTFRSRRVTLRQENSYPSDQDYALKFDDPKGFRLHLFGLQFKRWKKDGWFIDENQANDLNRMNHVIGFCFPRACLTIPSNSLHSFYFVNPSCVPSKHSMVKFGRFIAHQELGQDDMNWAHIHIFSKGPETKENNIPRLSWGEFYDAIRLGGLVIQVPGTPSNPPDSGTSPRPDIIKHNTGIGLTITCQGQWGSSWARSQITEHVRFWAI